MKRLGLAAAASVVIGLLLGATAVLGATLQIGSEPTPHQTDSGAAMLNRVEYGDRQ